MLSASSGLPARRLNQAVHRSTLGTREGILERLFTAAFRGLVYSQIWEDPEVDIEALALKPGARIAAIASGGCNVLSYLTADPASVLAVDLNPAHVALTRLKIAAIRYLPSHGAFYRFVGEANRPENMALYQRYLQRRLDEPTRGYWEGRDWRRRRRITVFSRGLYEHGLLGGFIGLAHRLARAYGVDPRQLTAARTIEEQQRFFDSALAPLFEKRLLRGITSMRISLFGLGIPPAQYAALAGGGGMNNVLRDRLERLACGFSLSDNYFAWQAFGRRYAPSESASLPPYLRRENFAALRDRADRIAVVNGSLTEELSRQEPASVDGFVLLDAQDWMTDAQLNALWAEITRTARSGARVIFRTAGQASILPGRVLDATLGRWTYDGERSATLATKDRSSVYGGFHLYVFNA